MTDKETLAYAKLTSGVLRRTTEFFHNEGFTQLMPVILSPITDPLGPDPGSTVIKTGEIEYLGQRLTLTQSMILHKQLAVKKGVGKLFIISPNVRLEHPDRKHSGKHLFEFSQVDFEIAHGKTDDVFGLMERFMTEMTIYAREKHASELETLGRTLPSFRGPFPRYTTHELEEKYGKDWEPPASLGHKTPFWVLCHRREFYDKNDPQHEGHFLNYDLIYPEGYGEALSGAEREHDFSIIMKKITAHQLDQGRYTAYLELAKDGLVPSAGGGFGVERLVRYLGGAKHVGDVQMFRRVPGEQVTA
jgi:asparaginyl-tRNA synthetase